MKSWLVMFVMFVALAACGGKTRKTLVPEIPHTGNAQARSRLADAIAKFKRDGRGGGEFREIVEEYPDDPIVPWANLYAGIAALKDRKFDEAAASLKLVLDREIDAGLTRRAQLFMGITKNYLGDARGALDLLKKAGKEAVEGDAERTEQLAAYAYAMAVIEPAASLPYFDQLYARVTPTERALIVARCEEVAATATPDQLRRQLDELDERKGPAMAAVASRLAAIADQGGNPSEAQKLRELAGPARAAVGLPKTIGTAVLTTGGGGNPGLVGAVLPGGKPTKAGDGAIAGLGLAGGAAGGSGVVAIEIRQTTDANEAALAVEDLAKRGVIAVIGPIDGPSVDKAGGRAEGLGIPLLSLSGRPEERTTGRWVFHMRHSAEARARALAKRALAAGIKSFAILAPEDNYGKSVTAAFVDELGRGGGAVASKVTYPADTKSFVKYAKQLSGKWDALFVPDEAKQLALIAPAVSATKQIPKPFGTKRTTGGRPILLMSTAEELTGAFIADAGMHADGAWLAPGFYPDDRDAATKVFVDQFIKQYARAPGVVDAYAYDAAQLAAAGGSGGRAGLAAKLSGGSLTGLTGIIKFDSDHRRADLGVVYTVVEDSGAYSIRVAP
ncbi:MAG: penicillin-binding protein activator [Kofleriaceae bacterium]